MKLYTPFFWDLGGWVLFLLHNMSFSFVPDVKKVLHPALVSVLLSWWDSPGMKGMRAYGRFCCSSISAVVGVWDALMSFEVSWNGRSSQRLVGTGSGVGCSWLGWAGLDEDVDDACFEPGGGGV